MSGMTRYLESSNGTGNMYVNTSFEPPMFVLRSIALWPFPSTYPWEGKKIPFIHPRALREGLPRRACALRAPGLLLADGAPTVGEDFLSRQQDFFTETAVTPKRKVEKWFPSWEINRHAKG